MSSFFRRLPWPRLIKFGLIGGVAFVIDLGMYSVLTRLGHWPYLLARTLSISAAMLWNFFLNRHWTFQAQAGQLRRQLARFSAVMLLTSLLSLALMRIGVSSLHFNDLLVLVVVSGLIMIVNFVAHHRWSYA